MFQQLEKSKSIDASLQSSMKPLNEEPKMQVEQPTNKDMPEDVMVEE